MVQAAQWRRCESIIRCSRGRPLRGAHDAVAKGHDERFVGSKGLPGGDGSTGAGGRGLVREEKLDAALAVAKATGRRAAVVEVILDRAFVASGDEEDLADASGCQLFDDVVDDRQAAHWQHLLGQGFSRGQESGAETGDRHDGFGDGHAWMALAKNMVVLWVFDKQ